MAIFDANFNPTNRQLRQFGTICLVALPLAAWVWTQNAMIVGWAGAAGLALCGAGRVAPKLLRPVFLALTFVTLPIGLFVGEIAMILIYFGLFLPMSIAFRITGRDALSRRSLPIEKTFWRERKQPANARSYYHQF
jgi:hypothetical protein